MNIQVQLQITQELQYKNSDTWKMSTI